MELEKVLLGKKVLVVDDMSAIRAVVKSSLAEMGASDIAEEGNGDTALKQLTKGQFDLVICDWDMPGKTGIEVLKAFRGQEGHQTTPFVMLTGMTDPDTVRKVIEAKVTDYIAKPFTPETLQSKVRRIFEP